MRFLLLIFSFLTLSLSAYSQTETEYFDQKFNLLPGKEGAAYYKITEFADKEKSSKTETTYFITGEKQAETKFIKTADGLFMPEGLAQKWYKNGQLYYTTQYRIGKKSGQAVGYYASGKLKRREQFIIGELTMGECYNEDETPASFYPHEVLPELPGGPKQLNEFVKRTLKYPANAMRNREQGTVVIEFTINETGKMVNSKVVNKVSPTLDAEALRVVRAMPDFKPATEEGIARAYTYVFPLRFGLVN
ncbi:MAG: TonB family protein [Adhaeribacter sp.]